MAEDTDVEVDTMNIMQDPSYPSTPVEDSEAIFDNEVMPLLEEAHRQAAKLGLPIMSFAIVGTDQTCLSLVTIKNIATLTAPMAVALCIAGGDHPAAPKMLMAAVGVSGDSLLLEKYTEMYAEVLGITLPPGDLRSKIDFVNAAMSKAGFKVGGLKKPD